MSIGINTTKGIIQKQQLVATRLSAQPPQLTDKYSDYLSEGIQPTGKRNNARNLFDDSNIEDTKWLKITQKHLLRLK